MTYRHYGLLSMALFTAAALIGITVMAYSSWVAVGGYVLLNILATVGILYAYCAKCTCRAHKCSHFLMGAMADRFFRRAPAPYTGLDYAVMLLSAGLVFVYPLYWLWFAKAWLAAYCVIFLLAGIDILFVVCPHCGNTRCPARGRLARKGGKQNEEADQQSPVIH